MQFQSSKTHTHKKKGKYTQDKRGRLVKSTFKMEHSSLVVLKKAKMLPNYEELYRILIRRNRSLRKRYRKYPRGKKEGTLKETREQRTPTTNA